MGHTGSRVHRVERIGPSTLSTLMSDIHGHRGPGIPPTLDSHTPSAHKQSLASVYSSIKWECS